MTEQERSLADAAPSSDDAVTPETTDLFEWARGVRPVRKSTVIHNAGHLIARLEQLVNEIEAAPEGKADELIDQFERLRDQVRSGTVVIMEQRSQEWVEEVHRKTLADLGVKPDAGAADLTDEQRLRLGAALVAAQIVEPEGFTADTLLALRESSPLEADRLAELRQRVNATDPATDPVLDMDFSSRRSGRR